MINLIHVDQLSSLRLTTNDFGFIIMQYWKDTLTQSAYICACVIINCCCCNNAILKKMWLKINTHTGRHYSSVSCSHDWLAIEGPLPEQPSL